jgi:hypothetical protein
VNPLSFLRPPNRRSLLALLAVSGVMTVAPARALLTVNASASGRSDVVTNADSGSAFEGRVVADIVAEVHMSGDGSGGDGTDIGLPGIDLPELSGGGQSGGGLDGALNGALDGALDGGLSGLDLPNGLPGAGQPGGDQPDRLPLAALIGAAGSVGGVGVPTLLGVPGLSGLGLPGLPSLGLPSLGLPGLPALPGLPTAGLPGTNPSNPPRPGTTVLPASTGPQTTGRLVADPSPTAAKPAVATPSPAPSHGVDFVIPATRGTLPRTGPGELFQGPAALALFGASAAARLAARRRQA